MDTTLVSHFPLNAYDFFFLRKWLFLDKTAEYSVYLALQINNGFDRTEKQQTHQRSWIKY